MSRCPSDGPTGGVDVQWFNTGTEFTWQSKRRRSNYPLDWRNPYVPQKHGGGEGWRGSDWKTIRKKALARAGNRSEVSGWSGDVVSLSVDHIAPYRIVTRMANQMLNLRIVDVLNWAAVDNAWTFRETRPERGGPPVGFRPSSTPTASPGSPSSGHSGH